MMPLLAANSHPHPHPQSHSEAASGIDSAHATGYSATAQLSPPQRTFTDPSRLAPEDAFFAHSPPSSRRRGGVNGSATGAASVHDGSPNRSATRRQKSRRRKGVWKKLLWVKQSYPDNYTDPPTFLSHLQRPRLQPYEFWPLVADSMVIVQHVCSVAIFVCCFVGIYQDHISPVSVVSWGSAGAVLGWALWDMWIGQEEQARSMQEHHPYHPPEENAGDDAMSVSSTFNSHGSTQGHGLGLTLSATSSGVPTRPHSRNISSTSLNALSPVTSPGASVHPAGSTLWPTYGYFPPYDAPAPFLSPRNQQRLATAKSAVLIYVALLGLSPILKSLTESTASDSIWAMSAWLMFINVFFFDYGGGGGNAPSAQFPASLSTNAALMASTVLASRLATITHVFSLTLFSIEVFGLFPVFRRHLRHRSWYLHIILTVLLILGAGAGLGITLIGRSTWKAAFVGIVVWGLGNVLAMGGCSWWLIGLQRYKNVVIGPWDPARPIIRAGG